MKKQNRKLIFFYLLATLLIISSCSSNQQNIEYSAVRNRILEVTSLKLPDEAESFHSETRFERDFHQLAAEIVPLDYNEISELASSIGFKELPIKNTESLAIQQLIEEYPLLMKDILMLKEGSYFLLFDDSQALSVLLVLNPGLKNLVYLEHDN